MTEPVNLNKARKVRDRAKAKSLAERNRVAFGRTKAEKVVERLDAERLRRDLDGKKRGD